MGRPKGARDREPRVRINQDGMTLKEIARELGIDPKTAGMILASGLEKLRRNPVQLQELIGLSDLRQSCYAQGIRVYWRGIRQRAING